MKQKPKIKAIIFDVEGVLKLKRLTFKKFYKPGDSRSSFHTYMAKKLRTNLDTWLDAIDSVFGDSMAGKINDKETANIISKNIDVKVQDLLKFSDFIFTKMYKDNKKLRDIAKDLKKKGYIVGILSDQWAFSKRVLTPKKDMKGFNPVIISCDVGCRKPSKEIYNLLMKDLRKKSKGIKPSEVVFIDNREYNEKGAEKIGINGILFTSNKQVVEDLRKLDVKI